LKKNKEKIERLFILLVDGGHLAGGGEVLRLENGCKTTGNVIFKTTG